ncbi:hypothetical protein ACFPME_16770 [Rhodanobacter umsongensis]|uniref:DUF4760 domain-containing protein n=1 Tax=Rhodanobacter umsongensis TaxID=633153 RepID=A0ABW0JRD3_9GAMM
MVERRWRSGLYLALAGAAGFAVGWLVFHLPEAACGPLRSELAAQWIAAGATLWAVLVAISASKRATQTALHLKTVEEVAEAKKLESMRLRLSVIFRGELYLLGGTYAHFREQIRETAASGNLRNLQHLLINGFPEQGLFLMEKFANDFYAFDADVGGRLAMALWRWKTYVQRPSAKDIHPSALVTAANSLFGSLGCAIHDLRTAHAALASYIPPNSAVGEDEAWFSNTEREYLPT